jgi:hypothetical protein
LPNAVLSDSSFDGNVELVLPRLFSIDEKTVANNPIQQLVTDSVQRRGKLTTFTRGRSRGFLFDLADGSAQILIVPPNTKQLPDGGVHPYVLGATLDPTSPRGDISNGKWLRHPLVLATAANETIEEILAS